VQSGTSYLSQSDTRQHFGLGAATKADVVEVRWPDGSSTRLPDVAADRVVAIEQAGADPRRVESSR
jgi:enediyne biosynthesis protein E4